MRKFAFPHKACVLRHFSKFLCFQPVFHFQNFFGNVSGCFPLGLIGGNVLLKQVRKLVKGKVMKRFYTILFAGLVGMSLVVAEASNASDDKGKARRTTSVKQSSNLRSSAGMMQGNGQNFKPQIQRQLPSRNLQQSAGLSVTNKIAPKLSRVEPSHKISGRAITKAKVSAPTLAGHPKLSTAIAKHSLVASKLAAVHFAPHHCHAPLTSNLWCHYYPTHCHWWWNYCESLHTCLPTQYYYWNWYYVSCPQIIYNGVVQPKYTWYLGVTGMLLPGSGLGIDSVAAGSPAELAGLRPGMVISTINEIALTSEAEMQQVIASSGGLLNLVVVEAADQGPVAITVQMAMVTSVKY